MKKYYDDYVVKNDNSNVTKQNRFSILAYILIGVIWSIFCLFVWVRAVFYGNWHWSTEELITYEPIRGRIAVFLVYAMPIIWIVLLAIIEAAIYVYYHKYSVLADEEEF